MERSRSDKPAYLAALAALAIAAGIIYVVVDASTIGATFDSNTPNATTQGPPASFEKP
jgi:NAD(P)H-hydrate repair Nnr-like enzyme with NAD(P)H-hydrate dehydratase domain